MIQQEIIFFWPLTEQIPLDLDYTGCERPLIIPTILDQGWGITTAINHDAPAWVSVNATSLTLDVDTTTIKVKTMPWYRKVILRLLGIKWEIKC